MNKLLRSGLIAITATYLTLCGQSFASAAEMSDAELAKKLKLANGEQLIRKDGKLMLLTPLDDETVKRLLKQRELLDQREKILAGVPRSIPAHAASMKTYRKAQTFEASNLDLAISLYSDYIKDFEKESSAIKNEPKNEHDYFLAWGYQNRAMCYLRQQHYENGVKDLNEAVKLRPRYATNYSNRARANRLLGNTKFAQEDETTIKNLPKPTGNADADLANEFPAQAKSAKGSVEWCVKA